MAYNTSSPVRAPDILPDPAQLSQDARDALTSLLALPEEEAATLIRMALEREDVRKAFLAKYVTIPAGVNVGERGENPLYLSQFYNAPVACVMAITRPDPVTGEWQLLSATRSNGNKTLVGGHYSPFAPQECWNYFFDKGFSVKELHHYFRNMAPPSNPGEDALSTDIDIIAAITKETLQESHIFLMPKELSDDEKKALAVKIRATFGNDVSISYDYEIARDHTLWTGVGQAGKGWHSTIIGFGIMLKDLPALNAPKGGDDIASVEWILQRDISALSAADGKTQGVKAKLFLGDLKYGEKPIAENAWAAFAREHQEAVIAGDGTVVYYAPLHEMERKAQQVAGNFGLTLQDVFGSVPATMMGEAASAYHAALRHFMNQHYQYVQVPVEQQDITDLNDLFMAEKALLKSVVSNAEALAQLDSVTKAQFKDAMLTHMAVKSTTKTPALPDAGYAGKLIASRNSGNTNRR